MKKFLVILMVVAMASFLFVGCFGTTPPIDPDEPVGPVEPTSTPPTIFDIQNSLGATIVDLTATTTQYINKVDAGTSILVVGIAGPKALVQVYIGGTLLPVNFVEAGATGIWTVAIAAAKLGVDGAKTLYATATEVALEESAASNVATFILDTDLPGIDSVAFTAYAEPGATGGTAKLTAGGTAINNVADVVDPTLIKTGTWTIDVLSDVGGFNTVKITGPGFEETYGEGNLDGAIFAANSPIPGVEFTLETPLAVGQRSEIVCKAQSAEIAGRATLKFDEDVSYAAATATTCVYGGVADGDDPSVYKESTNTGYWTDLTTITEGALCKITVYGVKDLAGNVGGTEAVPLTKSAIAGAASATLLKP